MKIIPWAKLNKYKIGFVLALVLCLHFFIQGLKKDHTLEMVNQKIELKEEARKQIQDERASWQTVVAEKDDQIKSVLQKDSALQQSILIINKQIDKISTKEYVQSKTKVFDTYNSNDIQQYYDALPDQPDNDY